MPSQKPKLFLFLFVLASLKCAHAQYEVPDEVFQRTVLIRSGKEQATAFKFDKDGKVYLVTTRRFGKNLPLTKALLQVWHHQAWNNLPTVRTLFPSSTDVDLAIIETEERLAQHYAVAKSTEVITTGQKVWFMGWCGPVQFPPDMRAAMPNFLEIPQQIGIGTVSVIEPVRPDAFEISSNRPYPTCIAGGPIVYWSSAHKDYEILGVIKRNARDAVRVPIEGKPDQEVVKSGIVHGYSIDVVVDAINDSPPS